MLIKELSVTLRKQNRTKTIFRTKYFELLDDTITRFNMVKASIFRV